MPSNAFHAWQTDRLVRLNAIDAQCHAAAAALPANLALADELVRGYVMLLSAQLQGYCRELYSECVLHVAVHSPAVPLIGFVTAMGGAGLELDRANPKWSSITADFDRFGFSVEAALAAAAASPGGVGAAAHALRVTHVAHLNGWRNYVAHHNLNPPRHGGPLAAPTVTGWKNSCDGLAVALDAVMYNQLMTLIGTAPWVP